MTPLPGLYALIAIPNVTRAAIFRQAVSDLARVETILVRDGDAALKEIAERGAPSVLVVDLSLPRIDGFALLRSLRAQGPGTSTRVIAVSAHETLRAAARDLSTPLGVGAVLPLDVDSSSLRDAVATLVAPADRSFTQSSVFATSTPGESRPMDPDEILDRAAIEARRRFRMPVSLGYLRVNDQEHLIIQALTSDPGSSVSPGELS